MGKHSLGNFFSFRIAGSKLTSGKWFWNRLARRKHANYLLNLADTQAVEDLRAQQRKDDKVKRAQERQRRSIFGVVTRIFKPRGQR